jgi:hypothetical protein
MYFRPATVNTMDLMRGLCKDGVVSMVALTSPKGFSALAQMDTLCVGMSRSLEQKAELQKRPVRIAVEIEVHNFMLASNRVDAAPKVPSNPNQGREAPRVPPQRAFELTTRVGLFH